LTTAVRQLGWRVYITTQPLEQLPLQEAVLAYRSEYLVERAMGRMKGRSLSLMAMYLEWDDHVTGLIRLLSLQLQVLTRLEFGVWQRSATAKTTVAGLYVSSPTRATAHLTAEHLLEAFQGLMLAITRGGRRRRLHLTPLASLHHKEPRAS
jgi:transposase